MGKTLKKEKRKNLKRRTNKRNTFQKNNEKKSRKSGQSGKNLDLYDPHGSENQGF